jgi:serine protease Do
VGINTAIASRSGGFQGIGFAVPIDMAESVMESLIEHGVSIQDLTETIAKVMNLRETEGALVGEVVEESPAQSAANQNVLAGIARLCGDGGER